MLLPKKRLVKMLELQARLLRKKKKLMIRRMLLKRKLKLRKISNRSKTP